MHESQLIVRFNRALPAEVYSEKTANPYRRGMPDCYYERPVKKVAWVEFKVQHNPLTPHQRRWLNRAVQNGVPAFVIRFRRKEGQRRWRVTINPWRGETMYEASSIAEAARTFLELW